MLQFDLTTFLLDKRISLAEFASIAGCSIVGAYYMKNRGTIKPSTLRKLEEVYGDCSQYLQVEKAEAV